MMSKRKRTGLVSWRIVADGFGVSAPMKLTVLDNSGAQQPLLRLLADVETVRPGSCVTSVAGPNGCAQLYWRWR